MGGIRFRRDTGKHTNSKTEYRSRERGTKYSPSKKEKNKQIK